MAAVELTDDQVLSLFRQLPAEKKRVALRTLADEAIVRRDENMAYAEAQLRERARERGMDWDKLDDDAREQFIDRLLHE